MIAFANGPGGTPPHIGALQTPSEIADAMILGALQRGGSPAIFGLDQHGRLLGISDARGSMTTPGTISSPHPRPLVQPPPCGAQLYGKHAAPYAQYHARQPHVLAAPTPASWPSQHPPHRGGQPPPPACAFAQGQPASLPSVHLTLHLAPHPAGGCGFGSWDAQPALPAPPRPPLPPLLLERAVSAPRLGAHLSAAPLRASPSSPDRRRRCCPYCSAAAFHTKDDLSAHVKACGLSFACSCDMRFQTRSKLMRHCRRCGHEPWRPPSAAAGSFSSGVESDVTALAGGALPDADDGSCASLGADAPRPVWAPTSPAKRRAPPAPAHARDGPHARAAEAVPTDACDELVDELLSFFADDEKGNGSEEASELFRLLREL